MCAVTVLVGAVVLGLSLRVEPGDPVFYPATLALAAVWVVGAVASGPLRLGRYSRGERQVRPVVLPLLTGLGLAGVFVLGALVVREIPMLGPQVRDLLTFAQEGALPIVLAITLVNGVAEEVFFRGAVFEAVPQYPIAASAAVNVLVVLASGNAPLAFAALVLALVVGWQRRITGGVLAPVITHLTWSTVMLLTLPLLFR